MGVLTSSQIVSEFGSLSYTDNKNGSINLDPKWVAANIVTLHTVLIPNLWCHAKVARQFACALSKIHMQGLGNLIHSFDGAFVPRHQMWDLRKSLSRHSYGIAIDLNAATNPAGKVNHELEPIAAIFSEFNIAWAGLWAGSSVDSMHFEWFAPMS